MEFILASRSPRRSEILKKLGQSFRVEVSDVEENKRADLSPEQNAVNLAKIKAECVFNATGVAALGADTVVELDGIIYGKPKDTAEAIATLKTLSGKTHRVITGVAVTDKRGTVADYSVSTVKIKSLTDGEIENYITQFNVYDKAGAYAVQDGVVVESYSGSYSNIVGLPEDLAERLLKEKNLWQGKN